MRLQRALQRCSTLGGWWLSDVKNNDKQPAVSTTRLSMRTGSGCKESGRAMSVCTLAFFFRACCRIATVENRQAAGGRFDTLGPWLDCGTGRDVGMYNATCGFIRSRAVNSAGGVSLVIKLRSLANASHIRHCFVEVGCDVMGIVLPLFG